jgi:peptidoglycan/xylan/chitin deacetylase (PgdA/CDA1 family)
MFRYTTVSILFFIILFMMIILVQRDAFQSWVLVLPIAFYVGTLILGSTKIGLNFYFFSYTNSKTTEKEIALTFDDGPHPIVTPKLIDVLEKHQATATFFCLGKSIAENKSLTKKIDEKGHLIGNHTYSHHKLFDLFSADKMMAEIKATNREIERSIGKSPAFFRPPYGVTNPLLKKALEKSNMFSIGWSLRSFDTIRDQEKVLKKLKSKTKAGDIVLFHDTNEKIIPVIEEYLNWLKSNHFEVVSLDKLLNIPAYETA